MNHDPYAVLDRSRPHREPIPEHLRGLNWNAPEGVEGVHYVRANPHSVRACDMLLPGEQPPRRKPSE